MFFYEIAAIIPFYSNEGVNSTCILLHDGSKIYKPCSVKKYLHYMLYEFHLDPRAVAHWTYEVIGSKLNTPLTISNDIIFLPVKMRPTVSKQDGCFGYVNNAFISSYDDKIIHLCNGETLSTLSSKTYLQKKQYDAKLLSYAYMDHKKQYEFMNPSVNPIHPSNPSISSNPSGSLNAASPLNNITASNAIK